MISSTPPPHLTYMCACQYFFLALLAQTAIASAISVCSEIVKTKDSHAKYLATMFPGSVYLDSIWNNMTESAFQVRLIILHQAPVIQRRPTPSTQLGLPLIAIGN